ncbi:hypothetical protein FRC03_003029 [Tulasnella sp. 419]|nr:hypothetical protein FRC03_003029 [Tulasnella sp. 419]
MRPMYSQPHHSYNPLDTPWKMNRLTAQVKPAAKPAPPSKPLVPRTISKAVEVVALASGAALPLLTPPPSPVYQSITCTPAVASSERAETPVLNKMQKSPSPTSSLDRPRFDSGDFFEVPDRSGFKRSSYVKGKRLWALHLPPASKAIIRPVTPPSPTTTPPPVTPMKHVRPDTFNRSPVTVQRATSVAAPTHWCKTSVRII